MRADLRNPQVPFSVGKNFGDPFSATGGKIVGRFAQSARIEPRVAQVDYFDRGTGEQLNYKCS